MAALPKSVVEAWEKRNGPVVLTTVDADGTPNSIYATCVSMFDDETIVIADNYFDASACLTMRPLSLLTIILTKQRKTFLQAARFLCCSSLMKIRHFRSKGTLSITRAERSSTT